MLVDEKLELCPTCQTKLNLEPVGSEKLTTCTKCGYEEIPGSAQYTTFFGEVLRTYLEKKHQVKNVTLGGSQISALITFSPRGLLHTFLLSGAELNNIPTATVFNMTYFDVVKDKQAMMNQRLVVRLDAHLPEADLKEAIVRNIMTNASVIDTAMNLGKQNSKEIELLNLPIASEHLKEYFAEELGIAPNEPAKSKVNPKQDKSL